MDDKRRQAYRVGGTITRAHMAREAPEQAAALDEVRAADVVVVPGNFDQVELVLDALGMPYSVVGPTDLVRVRLRPEQLLIVNCPGRLERAALHPLRDFVAAGGSLFTTDWALKHVIEPAFPGTISYNGRPTADDVVRIEVKEHDNPFLVGVMGPDDDPQWWLEGSSYPVRIHDPERVQVLIESRELGEKYGETPVAVLFRHGDGEVFHMISHYYLQRTELRSKRHRMSGADYAAAKGVNLAPEAARAAADLELGEVESAASSARFMANLLAEKKRRATNEALFRRTGAPPAQPGSAQGHDRNKEEDDDDR